MLGDELRDPSWIARHQRRGDPLLAVAQRVVLPYQDRVAVGGDDRVMDCAVGDREARTCVRELRSWLAIASSSTDASAGPSRRRARRSASPIRSRASSTSSASAIETGLTSAPRLGYDRAAPRLRAGRTPGAPVSEMPSSRASSFSLRSAPPGYRPSSNRSFTYRYARSPPASRDPQRMIEGLCSLGGYT